MRFKQKLAMTVAELLITFIVVAVASGLTIGVAVNQAEQKKIEASKTVFNNEVAVAMADMHANNELVGNTQKTFTDTLKKYFEIEELSKDDVSLNFAPKYTDEDGKEFSANQYKNWVISSKGIRVAYTYNEKCKPNYNFSQDASSYKTVNGVYNYLAKNEALGCIKGFYDVNGVKGPNQIGKDVGVFATFPYDCKDENGNVTNFIPNAQGKCTNDKNYCILTDLNCQKDGSLKTVDKNTCNCVCNIKCPKGAELNKKECTCGCNETKDELYKRIGCIQNKNGKYDSIYADCAASKSFCGCIPKNPNAPELCEKNGGTWNNINCKCDCENVELPDKCGYTYADNDDFCQIKCENAKKFTEARDKNITDNDSKSATLRSDVVNPDKSDKTSGMCFTCKNDTDAKYSYFASQKNCGCLKECKYKPNKKDKEFYTFDSNTCEWNCNTKKLSEYAISQTQKYATNLSPVIMDNPSYDTSHVDVNTFQKSSNNYKRAQEDYAKASALGYVKSFIVDGTCGKNQPECQLNTSNIELFSKLNAKGSHVASLDINGKRVSMNGFHRCAHCDEVYYNFKSTDEDELKFAGFLYYIGKGNSKPSYTVIDAEGAKNNRPEMKYVPDNKSCSLVFQDFSIGEPKTSMIEFHYANVIDGSVSDPDDVPLYGKRVKYSFYMLDGSVPNPNEEKIDKVKKEIKATGYNKIPKNKYSDSDWKKRKVGVAVGVEEEGDPLAIHINNSCPPGSNIESCKKPIASSNDYVDFGLKYDGGKFVKVPVKWQHNNYVFIVYKDFLNSTKNHHVGYMFSDVYSQKDNETYNSGFEALSKLDTNNDGLVTRDEFMGYLSLWDQVNNREIPIYDQVFDFNITPLTDTSGESGSKYMAYNTNGQYRKLVKQDAKPANDSKSRYVFVNALTKNNCRVEVWANIYNTNEKKYWRVNSTATANKLAYQDEYQKGESWFADSELKTTTSAPEYLYYYNKKYDTWYQILIDNMVDIIFKIN